MSLDVTSVTAALNFRPQRLRLANVITCMNVVRIHAPFEPVPGAVLAVVRGPLEPCYRIGQREHCQYGIGPIHEAGPKFGKVRVGFFRQAAAASRWPAIGRERAAGKRPNSVEAALHAHVEMLQYL